MMRTEVAQELYKNPDLLALVCEHLELFHKGGYSTPLIECIYQYHRLYRKPNIHDFYIFLKSHSRLFAQPPTLAAFQIPVAIPPFPDREVTKNNDTLKNNLPAPFEGEFYGGKDGADGYISWNTPIHIPLCIEKKEGKGFELWWALLDKGRVDLEVGRNSAEKFLFATLHTEGCARWPYKHTFISVFINLQSIRLIASQDKGFKEALRASGENISVISKSDRNPWGRWLKDVPPEFFDLKRKWSIKKC